MKMWYNSGGAAGPEVVCVASDIMGVSGRAMLAALVAGHTEPHALAELAKGRLRSTRDLLAQALDGPPAAVCRSIA